MSMYELPRVKVLGALSLIDQGELDWKILVVEESFSRLNSIRTIDDFIQHHPGALREIMDWFRLIKTFDGKSENKFAFDHCLSVDKTIEVILETHKAYKGLLKGERG
jgi:inorganic pyrophosphatase